MPRTLETVRSECGRVVARVKYCPNWQEYSVNIHVDGVYMPEATYLTDDKQDALDTVQYMISYALQHLPTN